MIFILICSTFFIYAESFSRHYRSFNASFESNDKSIIFNFDPFIRRFESIADLICAEYECIPPGDMANILEKLYNESVNDAIIQFYSTFKENIIPNQWESYVDPTTVVALALNRIEVLALSAGETPLGGDCNDTESLNNRSCRFIRLYERFNISNNSGSVVDWIDFAETLFNERHYEHAEAVCYFILYKRNETLSVDDTIRGWIILSEILSHFGHIEIASKFRAKVLMSTKSDAGKQAARNLLSILATPAIPPAPEEALLARQEMIQDLKALASELASAGVSISIQDLLRDIRSTPFHLSHQGLNDKDIQIAIHKTYTALCPDLVYISPRLRRLPETSSISQDSSFSSIAGTMERPLSIGFFSAYFMHHSIGLTLIEMLMFMNRRQVPRDTSGFNTSSSFTPDSYPYVNLTVFWLPPFAPGGSDSDDDVITKALAQELGLRFVRLPTDIADIRNIIDSYALDVLVYTDIGMDFFTYALAHSRLAPVQAAWWGHPSTTGLDSIDLFITLDAEVSDAWNHYSEQSVRMQFINTIPMSKADQSIVRSVKMFGIPEDSRIALVLGRLFKIHPTFYDAILNILYHTRALYPPVYILLIRESVRSWNDQLWTAMTRRFEDLVGPEMSVTLLQRIRLISFSMYTDALLLARVVLDTFPYGGCVTAHDATSNSVPTVTLPAAYMRGRFVLNMYKQMDYMELVTSDIREYVSKVIRLLEDDQYHASQKSALGEAFSNRLHKNHHVAMEWIIFFTRFVSSVTIS